LAGCRAATFRSAADSSSSTSRIAQIEPPVTLYAAEFAFPWGSGAEPVAVRYGWLKPINQRCRRFFRRRQINTVADARLVWRETT
jgi:hypothetical protein